MNKKIIYMLLILLCVHSAYTYSADIPLRHTIKPGDTVYSVARSYNRSVREVLQVNGINDPTEIRIGTNLVIPGQTGVAVAQSTHTVRKGDTYFNIARRYNLSLSELLELNKRTATQVLRLNETLRVSHGSTPTAPATPTARTAVLTRVAATNATDKWPHAGSRKSVRGKFPAVVINANKGDVVRAVTSGRIVHVDSNVAFGNVIFVQSTNGYIYIYGGNDEVLVNTGDLIGTGALIARVGAEQIGATTSQIYFSVWHNNTFIDPHAAPRG